ncbi:MAG: gellan polysaccharide biosynthesis protein GelF [Phenylobacterium sp.]|nr:gellan polysaccharide biosynthesis protein GelF [Phenylobacterium sp.]
MRLAPLALGAIVGVCAGSSALAQTAPVVSTKRQMTVGLAVAVVHDSNIVGAQSLAPTGLSPQETTLRPSVNFSITQPVGRQALFLRGAAGYDFHQKNPSMDSRRINVTGGGILRTSACQATIFGTYSSQQSELIDQTQVSVTNQLTTTSEAVGLACQIARGLGVQTTVERQDVSNSVPLQKLADHVGKNASGSVSYGRPSLGALALQVAYSDQSYPNRINVLGGVGDSYASTTIGLSYQKAFGQKLNLTVGGGRTMIKRDFVVPGMSHSTTATNYSANVAYILNHRVDFALNATKAVTPSNQAGKLFDIATSAGAIAHYKLGTRFVFGAGASVLKTHSNPDTSVGAGLVITNARTESVFASVRYQQSAKASVTFDVRQVDRKTNIPVLNYSDTRVSLTTAMTF